MSAVEYQEILKKAKQLSNEDQQRLVAELAPAQSHDQSREHAVPIEDDVGPVTRRLAAMNLPVADVETMKCEAQQGRWGTGRGE